MKSSMRFLFIGSGGIMKAHLRAFVDFPEHFVLAGVSDPSPEARRALLENYGKTVPEFDDHEAMLSQMAGEADAVVIGTPHYLHYPQAVAAVEAGLPCLVEKPVCNKYEEAKKLEALARERGITVMAGQTRRHAPTSRYAHDWVRTEARPFGDLTGFALESWQNILCWIATKPDKNADFWILDKARAGGGVVVSLSVHQIDLVRYLTGENFTEASAQGVFSPPFKNGAESACAAMVTMSNGAVGTLNANYLAKRLPYSESIKLFGSKGSIVSHSTTWGAYFGELRLGTTENDEPYGWNFQFEGLEPIPKEGIKALGLPSDFHFTNQLFEFRDALLDGRQPMSGIAENLNTMGVIEALYRSMNEGGKTVRIADL